MTARDHMNALLTEWGMNPAQIPVDGLYREGYEVVLFNEDGTPRRGEDGMRLECELRPYPEGFPYMHAMEIYVDMLKERLHR